MTRNGPRFRGIAGLAAACLSGCIAVEPPRGAALDASAWGRERAELSTRLAFDALQRGESSRAEQLLEDALGQDPRFVPALALRARLAHEAGDAAEAVRFATAWRAAAPEDPQALRLCGVLADAAGRHVEAEALLLEARERSGRDARASFDLYLHYLSCGRERDAESSLAGLAAERGHAAPLVQGATWHLERGHADRALAAYREARRRAPEDHAVAGHLAIGAWTLGRSAEVLEVGAELPPRARLEQPDLPLVLASARLETGDRRGALQELELVPLDARDATFCTLRGEVLLALGEADRALADFAEATRGEPNARAWLGAGRAALQCGLAGEALRALRAAERAGAASRNLHALIAAAHAALGEQAAARESLERARRAGADADVLREVSALLETERGR